MPRSQKTPTIPLPKGGKQHIRSAVLHVISLADDAAVDTRSWAADNTNSRVRLKAELDRAHQETSLRPEEIRIKDVRVARIKPLGRPIYQLGVPQEAHWIELLKRPEHWCYGVLSGRLSLLQE